VMILIGSDSDLPVVQETHDTLISLGVSVAFHVASPHRTPERVRELVTGAEASGTKVFVAASGGAAHLAGAVAATTTRPVVGIPLAAGALGGVDALYSTVNMPPGMPVGTVSVGTWGAYNAALLAAQILAVGDDELAERLKARRNEQREQVLAKDQRLQEQLSASPAEV
ncbi:MAG: 5-(carboxyamino)imidazole ribonucleotide mutase, partial [Planctomycetota bacterium]